MTVLGRQRLQRGSGAAGAVCGGGQGRCLRALAGGRLPAHTHPGQVAHPLRRTRCPWCQRSEPARYRLWPSFMSMGCRVCSILLLHVVTQGSSKAGDAVPPACCVLSASCAPMWAGAEVLPRLAPWRRFDLITDKGTFDAVGLAEGAPAKQRAYVRAAASLLDPPAGLLVVTSCNSTREELVRHFCAGGSSSSSGHEAEGHGRGASEGGERGAADAVRALGQGGEGVARAVFEYVDHVRTYPTFRFGGREGSRVCTVAFRRVAAA